MVYCTKCGTKNEENSVNCIKCKEPLMVKNSIRYERRRKENDCFGLPNGGAIVGMIFGLIKDILCRMIMTPKNRYIR